MDRYYVEILHEKTLIVERERRWYELDFAVGELREKYIFTE